MQGFKELFYIKPKFIIWLSIILLVIKVFISYEPVYDSLQYIELGTNFIQNAKYHLDGYPNRFSPVVPFWYGLVLIKNTPHITLIIVGLISIFHLILTLLIINKTFRILKIDEHLTELILILFVTNTHVFSWTGMLYPESFIGLYFWSFVYYLVKKNKNKEDWFLVGLTYSILCISKLVFVPLILVVGYFIIYETHLPRYLAILGFSIGSILLAYYVKYYLSVTMPDVSKLYDFDYGTRFDGSFKETLMKGLGFLPYKPGWKVDGIPSIVNIFIPKTGLRSWWMSLSVILLLLFPFLTRKRNNEIKSVTKILLVLLFLVFFSFVLAGTGFPRYWIPIYPIVFLIFVKSIIFVCSQIKTQENFTRFSIYTFMYIHFINNLRITLSSLE